MCGLDGISGKLMSRVLIDTFGFELQTESALVPMRCGSFINQLGEQMEASVGVGSTPQPRSDGRGHR